MAKKAEAKFIEPMLLLRTEKLPDGPKWLYQLKVDGYRAIAYKKHGKLCLRSRNDNDFTARYDSIAGALAPLPNNTVIDGEVVAFDEAGKPSFSMLQNSGSSAVQLAFFVFDLMVLAGRDLTEESLEMRLDLLQQKVFPKLAEPIRYLGGLDASLPDLIRSVKASGLEGLVAKRKTSKYEAGLRSGAWLKMRINQGQDERLPVAQTGVGRKFRVPGMDTRESSAPYAVCGIAGRQSGHGCPTGEPVMHPRPR